MKFSTQQMIDPDNLVVGKHYFSFWYLNESSDKPEIKTYVYIGKNMLETRETDEHYFQTVESYYEDGNILNLPKDKRPEGYEDNILLVNEQNLEVISDINGLLHELENHDKQYG